MVGIVVVVTARITNFGAFLENVATAVFLRKDQTDHASREGRFSARIFFHECASVSEGRFPSGRPAANRGLARELVCYPTRCLGLCRINHTHFRGTEFCAAGQFSKISKWYYLLRIQ